MGREIIEDTAEDARVIKYEIPPRFSYKVALEKAFPTVALDITTHSSHLLVDAAVLAPDLETLKKLVYRHAQAEIVGIYFPGLDAESRTIAAAYTLASR
jgi:hypothetical protein